MEPLTDGFGRRFHYLRLSVEDTCNFRCLYCLPDGYHKHEQDAPLTAAEIGRLVRAFSEMGFWKFRLTGGEPTVRRDILEIAQTVSQTPGVRHVALSTNGYRLADLAQGLARAGVQAVNVSVDSLDASRFREITGHDRLRDVLAGIDRCLSLGLRTKVNTVLMKDFNVSEWDRFLEWTREAPVDVRFIELMQTGGNIELFRQSHISAASLIELLHARGWTERPRREGDGPARIFSREGHLGKVGVIAPYSKDFCTTCNRLRVTSRGGLRLCLFAENDFSLRHLLVRDDQLQEVQAAVRAQLMRKDVSHYLPAGRTGNVRDFAMMGG